jgi:magnesium transporter
MDRYHAAKALEKIDPNIAGTLLENLPRTTAVDLIRLLNRQVRSQIIDGISPEIATDLQRILIYPSGTIGAYLNPEVFTLSQYFTVEESLQRIKSHALEVSSYIYVLDQEKKLAGFTSLKELIMVDVLKKVQLIMNTNPPSLLADTSISVSLLNDELWQGPFFQIPVVTIDNTFLGVVSKHHLANTDNTKEQAITRQAIQAGSALGDLYQIGLSSLFRSS